MYLAKLVHRSVIKVTILLSIQCPKSISPKNTQITFGTKVKVCSWIEVAVWNMLTIRPMHSEINSTGAEVLIIQKRASLEMVITVSTSILGLPAVLNPSLMPMT